MNTTKTKTEKKIKNLLNTAPTLWDCSVTGDPRQDWQEIERQLQETAIRAAMLAAYISERAGTYGCGAQPHKDAVKEANKTRAKVRKALGFSIPDAGSFTF